MKITMSRIHLANDTCHIYFMHTKVNHLLYTCSLVPFEDGILLDPSLVCIHRCERSYTFIEEQSKNKRTSTPYKREAWKRRRKRQEEGSSSQATPCARACTVPTGLTDPVRMGSCVRSLDTKCARAPLTPCTRGPLCVAVGLGPCIPISSLLTPSSLGLYILLPILHLEGAKNRSRH